MAGAMWLRYRGQGERMAKQRDMILVIRHWKEATGNSDIDMHEVAKFAHEKLGWELPVLPRSIDILAKRFSRAAREDIRHDDETGKPYRGYHAIKTRQGAETYTWWFDIDDADTTRKKMEINVHQRREQMIGDAMQLKRDAEHWNRINPDEEPIEVQLDLEFDVKLREHWPEEDGEGD